MRFKAFLQESRSQPVSEQEAFEWVKKHSRQYSQNVDIFKDECLFRGVGKKEQDAKPQLGDASAFTRKSANTFNYYTLFLDSSKRWTDFPDRSKSWICTTEINVAEGFGEPYMAFPMDTAVIGVCSDFDLWVSFDQVQKVFGGGGLKRVNGILRSINKDFSESDAGELRQQLSAIDVDAFTDVLNAPSARRLGSYFEEYKALLPVIQKYGNLELALENIFDPQLNNFTKTAGAQWKFDFNKEMWFSGPALFVPWDTICNDSQFLSLMGNEFENWKI